jgi:hypothetical protein
MTQHLRDQLLRLAARAGLSDSNLPTFDDSANNGRPHIEERGGAYYLVVQDRGTEIERQLFVDERELFYVALEKATFDIATAREASARLDDDHDSRREVFRIQEELMERIEPEWATRLKREHAELLRRHPFDDAAIARIARFKALRASGMDESIAWDLARQEFPEPMPG